MTHGNAGSGPPPPPPLPDPDTTGITAGFYLEKLLPLYHQFHFLFTALITCFGTNHSLMLSRDHVGRPQILGEL